MKKWLILALCLLMLAGCAKPAALPTPSGKDEQGNWIFDDEVIVGRVVPLTGPLASFGAGTPYVEQSAMDAVNEMGGVVLDGKRCKLVLRCMDSQSEAQKAADCARQLIEDGIDIMIVSNTADTVSPVSAVCEREGIACISVDAPASAWVMGGPYQNSWHTFFDNEHEMLCFYEAWESIESNRTIGLITANDAEGVEISTFIQDFANSKGYRVVDPGRYSIGAEDYSQFVDTFAREDCDILLGVMNTQDFKTFWRQCMEGNFTPKMCTVAKACVFPGDVESLGVLGNGLISEVWWTGDFPTVSSISGWSSAELARDYVTNYDPGIHMVPPSVGYKHANVEILYDILKRAGSLDLETINAAAAATDLDTVVGHVAFQANHVSVMACATGQWIMEPDGTYRQEIVGNYLIPNLNITAEIRPLQKEALS